MRTLTTALVLLAACGNDPDPGSKCFHDTECATGENCRGGRCLVVRDLGTEDADQPDLVEPSPDLARPDLAKPDLTPPATGDLLQQPDLVDVPDLLEGADLQSLPDLVAVPDLACWPAHHVCDGTTASRCCAPLGCWTEFQNGVIYSGCCSRSASATNPNLQGACTQTSDCCTDPAAQHIVTCAGNRCVLL